MKNWFDDLYGQLDNPNDPELMNALSSGALNKTPESFNDIQAPKLPAQRMPAAEPIAAPAPAPVDPMLADYLTGPHSLAARQKLVDQNQKDASDLDFTSALAAIGAGFQGKDAASAGMAMKRSQQDDR